MNILTKKLLREFTHKKLRTIVVVLSIALAISLFAGLLAIQDNVYHSVDLTYEKLHYEDAAFRTFGYAHRANFTSIANNVSNIETWDVRLALKSIVHYHGEDYNGVAHGVPSNRTPRVNNLTIVDGHYFTTYNETSVLVQLAFAKTQDLKVGDTLQLFYGKYNLTLNVIGIVFSPEYKYSVDPTGIPSPGSFAPIWLPIELLQSLLQKGDVINEYFIRVKNYSLINQTINQVKTYIHYFMGLEVSATLGTNEMDHKTYSADVGFLDDYAYAFGLLLMVVASFIIYDSITKIIVSERQLIGIMRAMGAKKSTLLWHYFLFGFILSILGFLLSLPLNYLIIYTMMNFYMDFLGLVLVQAIYVPWAPLIKGSSIILVLISFFTLFAAYKAITIQPVESIRGTTTQKPYKKSVLDLGLSKLFPHRTITVRIPLRALTNNKRRTIITAFTLVLSLVLVIASFGMIDSMNYQINQYYTTNLTYQLELTLTAPMNPTDIIPQILNVKGVSSVEGFIHQFASIENPQTAKNYTTLLSAFASNTSMRHYRFKEGNLKPGEIVIGERVAKALHLSIGDQIKIITQSYGLFPFTVNYFTVSGITQELVDIEVFLDLATAQSILRLNNNVTSLAVKATGDLKTIKHELLQSDLPISYIVDQTQLKNSVLAMMEGLISIMMVVAIIAIIVLILFTLNILVLEAMEHEREYGNLRVSGAGRTEISLIIGMQVFVLLIFVALFQRPFALLSVNYINQKVVKSFMYTQTFIAILSYAISDLTLLIGVSIGILAAIRYVLKLSLAIMTRTRFQT